MTNPDSIEAQLLGPTAINIRIYLLRRFLNAVIEVQTFIYFFFILSVIMESSLLASNCYINLTHVQVSKH